MGESQLVDGGSEALTATESAQLAGYEQIIAGGLQTFYEVGHALMDIRESRLYRSSHPTFDAYCQERWGMAATAARKLIGSTRVYENLQSDLNRSLLMPNEWQAQKLVSLEPDQQIQAWQQAVETAPNGKITGAHVARVVAETRDPMLVHYSSGTPEWYTPRSIVDRVIEFFDAIDLDPCSNSEEFPNVPAGRVFTERDNGLAQRWFGRVYMNPPYGDGIGMWTSKLAAHYEARDIEAGIALLPARTDTEWFGHLQSYAICFIRGRLKFVGAENSAPFPSMLVYLGDEVDRFTRVMAPLGRVWLAQP